MTDQITAVFAFNELIGSPRPPIGIPDLATQKFMVISLKEEIDEMIVAFKDEDVVKVVDAIIDNIYFAIGHLHRLGLTQEQAIECFDAVHTANMTKRKGKLTSRANYEHDAIKPADFTPPDEAIRDILFGTNE